MSKKRFWIGIGVTVLWLFLAAMLAGNELSKDGGSQLKLNEWGDFFAGFLSPLAFLWLVLGYLQQGEELKLSNEALKLQAEELKNAVEQQRDLVEVTRQQVEAERESLKFETYHRKQSIQPKLTVQSRGGIVYAGVGMGHNIVIANAGGAARNFYATVKGLGCGDLMLADLPLFKSDAEHRCSFEPPSGFSELSALLDITYVDADGDFQSVQYRVSQPNKNEVDLVFDLIRNDASRN